MGKIFNKICLFFLLTKGGEVWYNGISCRRAPWRHDNKKQARIVLSGPGNLFVSVSNF